MATMKAWQFSTTTGGLDKNLFRPADGATKPHISDDQILVEVHSVALNPADYKTAEAWFIARLTLSLPKVPCTDFCGKVVETGKKVDSFHVGEMVFGSCDPLKSGSLGEFVAVSKNMVASMPEGLSVDDAASIGIAGVTAYQSLAGKVKKGDKVFINGGSGGCGIYAIQIAKVLGCHVTVSCSTANIELCKSLGADEILDYKSSDILKQLADKGPIFDLAVDNVGSSSALYKASHTFLAPTSKFVQVGVMVTVCGIAKLASNTLRPGFLGGGKRKYQVIFVNIATKELEQIGTWMKEGKVRNVVDSVFEFDSAPDAFTRLKTGRAKGKIVVHVKQE
ncbi:reticulon-4-interacting protein 1, mitochondrial precursor [Melanomma pulvis-pyrius CBS 109.77]|uniref:Reticulon-4-interacting protein 1, mitochondrial n=1 Tax=Melanomma pulvis-pyrius CBS 109.77 TaxID=1314802 RepID=A0A6A6XXC7_9PLEO|nr:reticulon-4-interacting protein 1, mitochondrial precursor [Melanomma pulvis-pyrius CBS 109.77]